MRPIEDEVIEVEAPACSDKKQKTRTSVSGTEARASVALRRVRTDV